ncbi:response regulator [candidate division WOR-3 bacterium]|uniref:Response regulator n=1 Tax=candidate division WOR-3 bacterium TaxID=2052148 RepID=A0A9D5K8S2_UNCW3|nr:response regulator [candidate division WOR-3 bacterium]MBD3364175.1 response regulator [candidate division WOR-3 bacterium]
MKKKVLVVDEESKLRRILKKVLSDKGFEVEAAVNGTQALDMLPSFRPHLIIADVAMSGMDGFELCRRIREDRRFGAVRFIFLTAKDAREDEIEGLRLGADDYITKPFDVERLLARVETRLRWLDTANRFTSQESEEGIEGGLAGRNLIDILQVLEMSQKTGVLTVTRDYDEVTIFIDKGMITAARYGNKRGKFAVYAALSWTDGHFCFNPAEEVEVEERLQITGLLLEWANVADVGSGN